MPILNASPQSILLGTNDLSTREVYPEPVEYPLHLPKVYTWAEKGTTKEVVATGKGLIPIFGAAMFDKNSPYFTHASLFANTFLKAGNNIMVKRLVPTDANPNANVRIYLDVIQDDVPNYVRNSDGSRIWDDDKDDWKTDDDEDTIDGYRVKIITEYYTDGIELGAGSSKEGTMTKSDDDDTKSTMYPILDFKAAERGEYYNNVGIIITSRSRDEIPDVVREKTGALPFNIQIIRRKNIKSTPVVVKSKFGETKTEFTFKRNAVNPLTETIFDLESVFPENWNNQTDPEQPLIYSDFEDVYVYHDNINKILADFMEYEKDHISSESKKWEDGKYASTLSWFDFTTDDEETLKTDELHLLNWTRGKSSKGVVYFTVHFDDGDADLDDNQKEVDFESNIPIYLQGGSNGSMTTSMFETLVQEEMDKYLDPNSEVMDTAINVESIIYDSGFKLPTKKSLCNFVAVRKNTFVVLGTHDSSLGTKHLALSEHRAVAVTLKTRLQLTPESDYFGTPVMRGMIVAGSGILRDGSIKTRVPTTIEIAYKSAKYMGAGNRQWNGSYRFDSDPGNKLELLKDVEPGFIPAGVKPLLWNAGLVWPQPVNRREYQFPALQTVYDNDTSVLNSYFTAMAICGLNTVADETHRVFTGTSDMSNDQLATAVEEYYKNAIKNMFDNRFEITPKVIFTPNDIQRGYSWTLSVDIKAGNMKTVMTTYINSMRKD